MSSRRTIVALFGLTLVAVAPGCRTETEASAHAPALDDAIITVGSFEFTESELLAEIYSQALEADGYDVERVFGLGPREFVFPALTRGLVEVLPEYGGSALRFASVGTETPERDVDATNVALTGLLEKHSITVLAPAPAQDVNTFVVSRELAEREGLRTLSDVADIAGSLTFGGPPECPTRALCLVGLDDVYGIEFNEFVALDAGGRLTKQALENDGVDLALLFSTDPQLGDPELIELADDRGLQPAENVTPLVRTELIEQWGAEVVEPIDAVSERLTTERLRDLNARVESHHGDVAGVASAWLAEEGLR